MKNACVILNYNDAQTTKQLVNHIKGFTIIDYIIVVDNCSSDNSYSTLTMLANNKIHVIQTEENGGYGYGNNRGFEYAYNNLGAQYIAIVNPDVEFSEQCFETLINSLIDDNSCGAIAPISLDAKGNISSAVAWKQPSIILETLMSSVILNRLFKVNTHYNNDYIFSKNICEVDIIPGSFLLLNGDHFSSVGMYDESVFLYCEEKILAWKYSQKSIKTKLVTNINYIHRHSVTIDKNIKSHIKKTGIWLDSKKHFTMKYLLDNEKLAPLINIFFSYAKIESILVGLVKKLKNPK